MANLVEMPKTGSSETIKDFIKKTSFKATGSLNFDNISLPLTPRPTMQFDDFNSSTMRAGKFLEDD